MTEKILTILLSLFSIFFLVASFQIEGFSLTSINAATWPFILMVNMILLSLILAFTVFKSKKETSSNEDAKEEYELEAEEVLEDDEIIDYPKRFYYLILLFLIYSFALYYIGFIVSTILLLLALTQLFDMQKWSNRIITAIISTSVFVVVFPMILSIPLPRGISIFRDFSLLFY